MQVRRNSLIVLACCAVLLFGGSSLASAENLTEIFDQTYPLGTGGSVSLENINGNVTFDVWSAQEVRVQAVKKASSQKRLDGLKIEVDARGDSVAIDTEYPNTKKLGIFGEKNGHSSVTYTITVPANAQLRNIELVNGDLEITGIEGGAEASTVNGTITASGLVGNVSFETVNGEMEISLDRSGYGDRVNLESVNGRIRLFLPSSASARFDVETVNGAIKNDFGVNVKKGKYVGRSMNGEVGGGDVPVQISTVNGGVSILQR